MFGMVLNVRAPLEAAQPPVRGGGVSVTHRREDRCMATPGWLAALVDTYVSNSSRGGGVMRVRVQLSRRARGVLLGVSIVAGVFILLALIALYNSPPA